MTLTLGHVHVTKCQLTHFVIATILFIIIICQKSLVGSVPIRLRLSTGITKESHIGISPQMKNDSMQISWIIQIFGTRTKTLKSHQRFRRKAVNSTLPSIKEVPYSNVENVSVNQPLIDVSPVTTDTHSPTVKKKNFTNYFHNEIELCKVNCHPRKDKSVLFSSSLNLVIIPIFAFLFFLFFSCLRCTRWWKEDVWYADMKDYQKLAEEAIKRYRLRSQIYRRMSLPPSLRSAASLREAHKEQIRQWMEAERIGQSVECDSDNESNNDTHAHVHINPLPQVKDITPRGLRASISFNDFLKANNQDVTTDLINSNDSFGAGDNIDGNVNSSMSMHSHIEPYSDFPEPQLCLSSTPTFNESKPKLKGILKLSEESNLFMSDMPFNRSDSVLTMGYVPPPPNFTDHRHHGKHGGNSQRNSPRSSPRSSPRVTPHTSPRPSIDYRRSSSLRENIPGMIPLRKRHSIHHSHLRSKQLLKEMDRMSSSSPNRHSTENLLAAKTAEKIRTEKIKRLPIPIPKIICTDTETEETIVFDPRPPRKRDARHKRHKMRRKRDSSHDDSFDSVKESYKDKLKHFRAYTSMDTSSYEHDENRPKRRPLPKGSPPPRHKAETKPKMRNKQVETLSKNFDESSLSSDELPMEQSPVKWSLGGSASECNSGTESPQVTQNQSPERMTSHRVPMVILHNNPSIDTCPTTNPPREGSSQYTSRESSMDEDDIKSASDLSSENPPSKSTYKKPKSKDGNIVDSRRNLQAKRQGTLQRQVSVRDEHQPDNNMLKVPSFDEITTSNYPIVVPIYSEVPSHGRHFGQRRVSESNDFTPETSIEEEDEDQLEEDRREDLVSDGNRSDNEKTHFSNTDEFERSDTRVKDGSGKANISECNENNNVYAKDRLQRDMLNNADGVRIQKYAVNDTQNTIPNDSKSMKERRNSVKFDNDHDNECIFEFEDSDVTENRETISTKHCETECKCKSVSPCGTCDKDDVINVTNSKHL
ncbi:unnamed protein product [Owenia fusiformis]|uniref:Uncharacterized protein n=1 Tax=Owenia fusiformis TaxID=6347 RepID=A0A8S4Q4R4_OWEFU|nr:unnamed protein product [Owenia fusiformis]